MRLKLTSYVKAFFGKVPGDVPLCIDCRHMASLGTCIRFKEFDFVEGGLKTERSSAKAERCWIAGKCGITGKYFEPRHKKQ